MELLKKSVLKAEYDFDFHLWGVVCTLKDFQAVWEINHALKINLKRERDDLEIQNKAKGLQMSFSVFAAFDRFEQGKFHLVSNKYLNEHLIPEMKEIDFFLRYSCESSDEELFEILTDLKRIKRFTLVVPVNPNLLKSKHHLIIE